MLPISAFVKRAFEFFVKKVASC